MRTTVRGLAAVALLLAGAGLASAGWGLWNKDGCSGCGPAGCPAGPVTGYDQYEARMGWHPCIKWLCGKSNPPPPPAPVKAGPPAGMQGQAGGTLVFPNHQYMRSPRDYFMED